LDDEFRQGCIKLPDFSLFSIGWRRGLGRGGAFLLVSPLLSPLPARASQGEEAELDAALEFQLPSHFEIDYYALAPDDEIRYQGSDL
jgi:hypothetical protein